MNQYQYEDFLARKDDLYAQTKYQIILDFLSFYKPARILNVGCGSGELSFLLARVGYEVVGIDPGGEYIDLANRNLPFHLKGRCSFVVASVENYRAPHLFDCIVSADVFEHIEDDVAAMNRSVKLIKSGGTIVLAVPALQFLFGYHDEQLGHFRRYNRQGLRALFRSAGLKIEKIRYFGFFLVPLSWLYGWFLRRGYPVSSQRKSRLFQLRQIILRTLFRIEKKISFPIGTSLIGVGRKSA